MLRCVFIFFIWLLLQLLLLLLLLQRTAAGCVWRRWLPLVVVGWLVGWLFGCCCCSLFGWWVDLCVHPHTKSKNIFKNGISFHICTHRERNRERQNMFGNIGVATATRTKLETNSQYYIHIESGNQREKEREQDIYTYVKFECVRKRLPV